jgi:osmotically-inducible protein OsmY
MKPQSNEVIKKNIVEQLAWNDAIDANKVQVEIKDKKVILTGTVPSYSSKIDAAREAMSVAGNYEIENLLTVKFEAEHDIPNDFEITKNIQNILKWNSDINPVNIQVETDKGVVTLSGTVSRSWEKSKAEKIINATKGVVNVVNNIKVKPSSVRSDLDIERDLQKALERNPLIGEDAILVEVENGVINVSGSVATESIRDEILDQAINTAGVVDVVNEITIG